MTRQLSSAGLMVVALSAAAGQGYLPVVGPPMLRFQPAPPPPPAVLVPLPPLAAVEPRPTPAEGDPGASTATVPSSATVETLIVDPFAVPPAPDPIPTPATNQVFAMPADTETLVPQMFMRYFIGGTGTNSAGVSIFPPVGFVPPMPMVPPSSSATFQTVPPPKP